MTQSNSLAEQSRLSLAPEQRATDPTAALMSAVAGLAQSGLDESQIMQLCWQACLAHVRDLPRKLEKQETEQLIARITDLRQRGKLALA